MIRLQRIGRRNDPAYRIAVLEKARAARTGRVVEALGSYNPKTKSFTLDETRAKEWISQGALPTTTIKNLFIAKGVIEGKKGDAFPSSARKKAREAAAKTEAEAAAAKKAEEAAAVAAKAEAEAAAAAPAPEEVPAEAPAETPVTPEEVPATGETAPVEEAAATEEPAA